MIRFHRSLATVVAWCLLVAAAAAANVRWTGNAQDVRQVTTIAVSGTWATADTATITCNKKSVTVTLGTPVATTDVAAALAAAINATSATDDLVSNETRNVGGQEIAEFTEISASASGSTLTLTSATPGVPFTVTRSEATVGSGALGAVTQVTAATGRNWLSNADNYEGGSLPVDNDTLYIDTGSVSILYGLDYFRANSVDLNVVISNDWLGQLGLPLQNVAGYVEYRGRWFQFQGLSKSLAFIEGTSGSAGQGRCWVDLQDQSPTSVAIARGRGENGARPSIFLAGSNVIATLSIQAGNVSIEPDDAGTNSSKYFRATIWNLGSPEAAAPLNVYIGRNTRLSAASDVGIYGGTVVSDAPTNVAADFPLTQVFGGTLELRGVGDEGDFKVSSGATLLVSAQAGGGTMQEVDVSGTIDCRRTQIAKTPVALRLYEGAAYYDPTGAFGGEVDLVRCSIDELEAFVMPEDRHLEFNTSAAP